MNKKKLTMGLALALLMLPATAFATTVEAVADKTSVQAGDTVEVVITVQGEDMSIAEGSFTYDPAVLTFTEGEGGASDGFLNLVSVEQGGTDTLKARIVFTAAGEGTANVEAKIEKVLDYDGKEQEGAQASVSIGVSAPAPTPTPEPLDYAKEGVPAQNVQGASETMYIWKNLENVTIPSNYSETTLEYHEETVAAVQVPDSDAPTLLYLSNQTGDQGGYYIYNAAQDLLYPYMTISSVSKSYIILEPDIFVIHFQKILPRMVHPVLVCPVIKEILDTGITVMPESDFKCLPVIGFRIIPVLLFPGLCRGHGRVPCHIVPGTVGAHPDRGGFPYDGLPPFRTGIFQLNLQILHPGEGFPAYRKHLFIFPNRRIDIHRYDSGQFYRPSGIKFSDILHGGGIPCIKSRLHRSEEFIRKLHILLELIQFYIM